MTSLPHSPAVAQPKLYKGDESAVRDYIALLKPRVMSLVVFTALTGMVVAPGPHNAVLLIVSLIAIAVGAGASGALNMWYDADIDRLMSRTVSRPIPAGRVVRAEAAALGLILSLFSVLALGLASDSYLAAGLLAFTIFFYAVVYTIWLKRHTAQNIVIGGAAGALPPVIGWAAMTGHAPLAAWSLFIIIFLWTPAHFWALALGQSEDYARARIPMMPNVAGPRSTKRQIIAYTALTVLSTALPVLVGLGGWLYAGIAGIAGAAFLLAAWRLLVARAEAMHKRSRALFGISIIYLFLLFAALLCERLLGVPALIA